MVGITQDWDRKMGGAESSTLGVFSGVDTVRSEAPSFSRGASEEVPVVLGSGVSIVVLSPSLGEGAWEDVSSSAPASSADIAEEKLPTDSVSQNHELLNDLK